MLTPGKKEALTAFFKVQKNFSNFLKIPLIDKHSPANFLTTGKAERLLEEDRVTSVNIALK